MKRKKLFTMLGVLVIVLLIAATGLAAGGESSAGTRYYYQLVPVTGEPGSFSLYVERTDVEGTPLHAGNIALAVPLSDGELTFVPETGWATVAPQYSGPGQPSTGLVQETGTLTDGRRYISFSWYWQEFAGDLPSSSGDYSNRQLLGKLSLPDGLRTDVESIQLLPWTETVTGAQIMQQWLVSTDKEAYKDILDSYWRMPNFNTPEQGYYQGFYVSERPDGEEGPDQYAVDLTAGWQGFTIGAYAPEKPATLLFYKYSDDGTSTLYAVAETTFGSGTGYFRGKVDFSALVTTDPDTKQSVSLVSGVYDLVILKPSHVKCEIKGVEYDETNHIFPELQGLHVEIPCGDLVVNADAGQLNLLRGDGVITLQDRSVLLACLNGTISNTETEFTYADLDGDGVVSLADLDILMSAENYNKESIIIKGKGADI